MLDGNIYAGGWFTQDATAIYTRGWFYNPVYPDVPTDVVSSALSLFISQYRQLRESFSSSLLNRAAFEAPADPVSITDAAAQDVVSSGLTLFISQFKQVRQ